MLIKTSIRDFYIENNILYINNEGLCIEVEMVRKTSRYEVKYNGVMMSDSETSQCDIDFYSIKFEFYRVKKCWYYWVCEDNIFKKSGCFKAIYFLVI